MNPPPTARALAAHDAACRAGQAGYMDPVSGLFVMTSVHLAKRPCCGNGCRHCPWPDADQAGAGRDPRRPAWPWRRGD